MKLNEVENRPKFTKIRLVLQVEYGSCSPEQAVPLEVRDQGMRASKGRRWERESGIRTGRCIERF